MRALVDQVVEQLAIVPRGCDECPSPTSLVRVGERALCGDCELDRRIDAVIEAARPHGAVALSAAMGWRWSVLQSDTEGQARFGEALGGYGVDVAAVQGVP